MSQNLNNITPQISNQSNFKSAYSKKHKVSLTFPENSRWTKQQFREECDINTIMNRYLASGEMPAINQQAPQYLDVTGQDYQESMQFIAGAQSLFNELPSSIRNRFQNDPATFLDFCSQDKNRPEMAEMGLLRDEVADAVPLPSSSSSKPPKTANSPAPDATPPAAE